MIYHYVPTRMNKFLKIDIPMADKDAEQPESH